MKQSVQGITISVLCVNRLYSKAKKKNMIKMYIAKYHAHTVKSSLLEVPYLYMRRLVIRNPDHVNSVISL